MDAAGDHRITLRIPGAVGALKWGLIAWGKVAILHLMDSAQKVTIAQVIGQMLIADGALNDAEREHFENLMARLGMNDAEKQQAIKGIDVDSPAEERVASLSQEFRAGLVVELEAAMAASGEIARGEQILMERLQALLKP